MKCLSRSTLGVGIGCINILGFSITIIYIIEVLCVFGSLTEEDKKDIEDIWTTPVTLLYIILVICVIAIIISGLLIAGIVKRRHSLMKPWIYCAIAGIVCHIFRLLVGFFSGCLSGAPFISIFSALILGSLTLGLQFLIFYPIFELYKDIRDKGNELENEAECEESDLNINNDNPPSYGDLERKGEL